jgi:hypothetical protein
VDEERSGWRMIKDSCSVEAKRIGRSSRKQGFQTDIQHAPGSSCQCGIQHRKRTRAPDYNGYAADCKGRSAQETASGKALRDLISC